MKNNPSTRLLLTGTLILAPVSFGCVSTTLQLFSDHPARIDAPSGRVESEPAAILRPNAPLYLSGNPLPQLKQKTADSHRRQFPAPTRLSLTGRVKRPMWARE